MVTHAGVDYECGVTAVPLPFPLQELQVRCAEGQALLNSVLHAREEVIPSGIPQTEDRALESLRQDWQAYQQRLSETRTQFNNVVNKLRLMEQKYQQVDEWLKTLESKVSVRTGRQASRAAKEMQLHQMKVQLLQILDLCQSNGDLAVCFIEIVSNFLSKIYILQNLFLLRTKNYCRGCSATAFTK